MKMGVIGIVIFIAAIFVVTVIMSVAIALYNDNYYLDYPPEEMEYRKREE